MIGNADDAETAQIIDLDWNESMSRTGSSGTYCIDIPEAPGWFAIGRGATRRVFLSPEGVVYKVASRPCHNEDEAEIVAAIRPFFGELAKHNIRIPDCTLWGDVLAMEFVEGTSDIEFEDDISKLCETLNNVTGTFLWDIDHWFNWIVDDEGNYWCVDISR